MTLDELKDGVARMLRVRRPVASRVVRWLRQLYERNAVHGEAGLVPFVGGAHGLNVLVGTVDYRDHAVGCAWCGEFIADHAEALVEGSRAVVLDPDSLPRDLAPLQLHPAVLYCGGCWATLAPHLRAVLGVEDVAQ